MMGWWVHNDGLFFHLLIVVCVFFLRFCLQCALSTLSTAKRFTHQFAPRSDMRKAEKVTKFGTEARLTRVQELKQALLTAEVIIV